MRTWWIQGGSRGFSSPDLLRSVRPCSLTPVSMLPRSQLAVIPQEPFLFSGTVRENLDPQGLHEDRALWQALEQCHLSEVAVAMGESWAHRKSRQEANNGHRRQCGRSAYRWSRWRAGGKGPKLVPRTETAAVSGKSSSHRC